MSLKPRTWAAGLLALAVMAAPGLLRADPLADASARLKIEAQRVEREFTDTRAAAYRLVRTDSPRLADALEKIDGLLALVGDSRALSDQTRKDYIATLRYDRSKLREIAEERRRASERSAPPVRTTPSRPTPSDTAGKGRVDDVKSRIDRTKGLVADGRIAKLDNAERRTGVMTGVEKSAKPETADYTFPKNWKELSERRSGAVKMTETERKIMTTLDKQYEVDFERTPYQDVMDYLRKVTGLPISVDKRALEEAGQSYDSPVTLKTRLSLRAILKKINGEMGMAYVIKDETVLITSQARANTMTVTRAYYLGDMVAVTGLNLDPITTQLLIQQRANMIISTVMSKVDSGSWKSNNPDATGVITFDPLTMSLIVKQTAEFHFKNFGAGR